jgi:hypothetical protein
MEDVVEQGCFVVLVGSFNPTIFSPYWLAEQGIVSSDEASEAVVEIIHKEVCRFSVANLKFEVLLGQLVIFAEAEPFARVSDTVALLFLEKLPHTPITAFTINYYLHANIGDPMKRVRFGRLLAPLDIWSETELVFEGESVSEGNIGGVVDLTMQVARADDYDGYTRVAIQPSYTIPDNKGLFVQILDHFGAAVARDSDEVEKPDRNAAAKRKAIKRKASQAIAEDRAKIDYVKALVAEFNGSLERSIRIASKIVERAGAA